EYLSGSRDAVEGRVPPGARPARIAQCSAPQRMTDVRGLDPRLQHTPSLVLATCGSALPVLAGVSSACAKAKTRPHPAQPAGTRAAVDTYAQRAVHAGPLEHERRNRMQLRYASLVAVPLLALAVSAPASAQGRLSVTPLIGGYIPGDDIYEVADAAERVSIEKEATLAFGLNVEFGMLRGSLAYATGATISEEGQSGDIGEGSVLAATAD